MAQDLGLDCPVRRGTAVELCHTLEVRSLYCAKPEAVVEAGRSSGPERAIECVESCTKANRARPLRCNVRERSCSLQVQGLPMKALKMARQSRFSQRSH